MLTYDINDPYVNNPTKETLRVTKSLGGRSGTVVKVLCYKSEGRYFDRRRCHWNFSLT